MELTCPLCRLGPDVDLVQHLEHYRIYQCRHCKVQFADPMKGANAEFYRAASYYEHRISAVSLALTKLRWEQKRVLQLCPPKGKRVLDVGMGIPAFLAAARDLGAKQVTGTEIDSACVAVARHHYDLADVVLGTLGDALLDPMRAHGYDIVTFFEVIEHLEDPRAEIDMVKLALAPGGYIAATVPNRDRILPGAEVSDCPPNHLTKWNAGSLRHLFEVCGFEVVHVELDPMPRALRTWLLFRLHFLSALYYRLFLSSRDQQDKGQGEERHGHLAVGLSTYRDAAVTILTGVPDRVIDLLRPGRGRVMLLIARAP